MRRILTFDINIFTGCNLRCSYCFENKHLDSNTAMSDETIDTIIDRLYDLLDSDYFIDNYDILNICFWGGEPSMNPDAIYKFNESFLGNDQVKFMLYTNGYKFPRKLKDIIIENTGKKVQGHPRFFVQVSYDGAPAQKKNRKTYHGIESTVKVQRNIEWLRENGSDFSLKSTIDFESFKIMDECYLDIQKFYGGLGGNYFPTIDYLSKREMEPEQFEQYMKDLEGALIRIASHEVKYFHKYKKGFFSWFMNSNKAICNAGRDGFAIDIDGSVYKCHGTLYSENKHDHLVTNIKDGEFIRLISLSKLIHNEMSQIQPLKCISCSATFCLRCNSMKYELSKKKDYQDRWTDYTNQPELCDMYIMASKIKKAFHVIRGLHGSNKLD